MKKDNSFLINYSLNFLFYFPPCYEVHIFIYFSIFISVFLMQFFIIIVANFSTKQVPLRLIAQIIPLFCPNFGLIPYSIFERFHWWISNLASDQRVSNIRKSSIVKYETLPIQLCNANSSSLSLIFAKCMNDFFLSLFFLCILFHRSSVKWISKFSFQGQKDGKLQNSTKCTHLIYTYTQAIRTDISVLHRCNKNIFFKILDVIQLPITSRSFSSSTNSRILEKIT